MQPQSRQKPGPPPTGKGTPVQVRLQPDMLAQLDAWIAGRPDPKPSRPEAIRAFVVAGLHLMGESA